MQVVITPEIEQIIMSSNNSVDVGDVLKIECIATGFPEPTYSWTKIDNEVKLFIHLIFIK